MKRRKMSWHYAKWRLSWVHRQRPKHIYCPPTKVVDVLPMASMIELPENWDGHSLQQSTDNTH